MKDAVKVTLGAIGFTLMASIAMWQLVGDRSSARSQTDHAIKVAEDWKQVAERWEKIAAEWEAEAKKCHGTTETKRER